MITTTLNAIRAQHPCPDGWYKLLRHLGKTQADDETLPLVTILDSNGIDDTLWCLRIVDGYEKEKRLFAVWCARQVQHLTSDPRSVEALDVAERFAHGEASTAELTAANYAAWAAADAIAQAANAAAWAAAAAAWAANEAANEAAARVAARAAARAAWATANEAASQPSRAAAYAAAYAAAQAAQIEKFKEIFG